MAIINISQISQNKVFDSPVTVGGSFVLVVPPCKFQDSYLNALKRWGYKTVEIEEDSKITAPAAAPKVIPPTQTESVDLSEFDDSASKTPAREIPEQFKTTESVDLSDFNMDDDDDEPPAKPSVSRAHSSLSDFVEKREQQQNNISQPAALTKPHKEEDEEQIMQMVQQRYDEFFKYIFYIYTHYSTHKEFEANIINEKTLELCNFIREYKSYILRLSPNQESRNKNFLISHSLRSAIYSIVIGQQLKMPYDKLVELGVSAILHEIGQIRLPPQLYINDKPLSPAEKQKMNTHSILGYQILKENGFSLPIQLGVLEHHERETGIGYPRKLTGDKISLYAKIIAVACSFEAITAPRHFKEARTTYEGMVEMLKNSNHLYDDTVVKALLYSISLFPVGAYVYLMNGRIAQVVDVSPTNPKNPIINIIGERNPDGSIKTVQSDDGLMKIMRVLNAKESEDLKATIKKNGGAKLS